MLQIAIQNKAAAIVDWTPNRTLLFTQFEIIQDSEVKDGDVVVVVEWGFLSPAKVIKREEEEEEIIKLLNIWSKTIEDFFVRIIFLFCKQFITV